MKATAQDLWAGAHWLGCALDDFADDDASQEIAEGIRRCIEYLMAESDRRDARSALAVAKREYAAAHGIKVSQVRVKA
jgi:hypothetical protein